MDNARATSGLLTEQGLDHAGAMRGSHAGGTHGDSAYDLMERRRNLFIGIVVGIAIVTASVYATGYTKRLLSPFLTSSTYTSSGAPTAPELATGNWINSEPLNLKDLRGRVVLVEFWTFGCYNCRNTLPFIKGWHDRYRDQGLTVVGVHSPEFDEERQVEKVRSQVASLGIHYPVLTDNDYLTWNAYGVEAWPTMFLLDKQGRIRWKHVGEGNYDEAEQLIQKLLAEKETVSRVDQTVSEPTKSHKFAGWEGWFTPALRLAA